MNTIELGSSELGSIWKEDLLNNIEQFKINFYRLILSLNSMLSTPRIWIPPSSLPARISSKNDEIPLPKNQEKCLQEKPA